jgi:hypothetical protein
MSFERMSCAHLSPGRFQPLEAAADRVAGVAEDEQMAAAPERRVDAVQVEGRAPVFGGDRHRDLDDLAPEGPGDGQERHVGGGRQDDRAARPGENRDRGLQAGDHVRQRANPGRVHRPVVVVGLPSGAGLRHLGGRPVTEVAEVGPPDDVEEGRLDRRRGAEVHLRDERADRVGSASGPFHAAACAQFVGGDLVGDLGERGHGTCFRVLGLTAAGWSRSPR